jgi:hypothetical protein
VRPVRPVRPVRMKGHHDLPSCHLRYTPPGVLALGPSGVIYSTVTLPPAAGATPSRSITVTDGPRPARFTWPRPDHCATNVQLTTVLDGQLWYAADGQTSWSRPLTAVLGQLPKLMVRVRFSSPAPRCNPRSPGTSGIPPVSHRNHSNASVLLQSLTGARLGRPRSSSRRRERRSHS